MLRPVAALARLVRVSILETLLLAVATAGRTPTSAKTRDGRAYPQGVAALAIALARRAHPAERVVVAVRRGLARLKPRTTAEQELLQRPSVRPRLPCVVGTVVARLLSEPVHSL